MSATAVIVPWAPGCEQRERVWAWVRRQYETDGWEVIEAPGGQPWVKADAVRPAIETSSADIVVVADADCWCDRLQSAVDRVDGGAPWAMPHQRVRRLDQESTGRVLDGAPISRGQLEEPPYLGAPGGGIVVLPRATALEIPLDPRFVGWNGEDRSWAHALRIIAGVPWRGNAVLWHLWHPPQPRPDRNHGSPANEALKRRYFDARRNPAAMRALIDEVTDGNHAADAQPEGHQRDSPVQ